MSEELTNKEKIERLKITTQRILEIPSDFVLPNGWNKKELYIHLWPWDNEFNKNVKARLQRKAEDFQFEHQKLGMDYEKWNDMKIEEKSMLSLTDAEELFLSVRKEFLANIENLIKYDISDENQWKQNDYRRVSIILNIWWHDYHHLKKGNFEIEF